MKNLINVTCFVFPTNETLWFKTDSEYQELVLKAWKEKHPEFEESDCTMGVVNIIMPEENYDAIKATNQIDWPKL